MFAAFKALVKKDLSLFLMDRRAVLMTVAGPIAIASFFGYIFGGSGNTTPPSRVPVAAVDLDRSDISRDIVSHLSADSTLKVTSATLTDARAAVRKGKISVALVIPPDFGHSAGSAFFGPSAKPEIALLYDPSHQMEMSMVQGVLSGHVMEAVSKEVFTGQTGRQTVKDSLAELEADATMPAYTKKSLGDILRSVDKWNEHNERNSGQSALTRGLTLPFETRSEAITSGTGVPYNGYAHSFGGMGIQFVLFMGIDVGIGLLVQRQRGIWRRLRAAPISRTLLLGSRSASTAITSFAVMMVIFAFARVVFGVGAKGSMAGFLLICAAFSLMTAAIGLLIAALGKTPEAARGISILVTLLLVMLGGSWAPTFIFPQWLQNLTVAIPTRWAMDGLDAVTWRGLGFSAALAPAAGLCGCAVIFGALAVLRFKWEVD
jgi:ABC-2 type transport system permease protein